MSLATSSAREHVTSGRGRWGEQARRPLAFGGTLLVLLVLAAGELGRMGGAGAVRWWADLGWTGCACVATGGCLVAARRGVWGRPTWLLFAGGCTTWLAGQCAWDYYELVAQTAAPFPSLADAGWLGFVPWFAGGLLALPRREEHQSTAVLFGLDLAVVAVALILIGAVAGQGLLVSSTALDATGKAVVLAYPVAYLTLALGAFLVMVRTPTLARVRGMALLAVGLLCIGGGFVAWAPLLLTGTYQDGTVLDIAWMAGLLAIGLAGLEWQPKAGNLEGEAAVFMLPSLIPTIVGTSVAFLAPVLAYGIARAPVDLGARVLIGLIAARQLAGVVENARLYRAERLHNALAQQRAERLHRVQEVGQTLGLELDPAGIGQLVVDAACTTLGFGVAVLNLVLDPTLPPAEQRTRAVAARGLDEGMAAWFLTQEAPASEIFSLLREEFRISHSFFLPAERTTRANESTTIPSWAPPLAVTVPGGWRSGDDLLVPLIERRTSRFLGFLSLDVPRDGQRPGGETVELLEIFADQAALAISNARLYAEARRRTQRSEAVGALLHALGHHLEVTAVLCTGLEGLVSLTGADSASLYDYDAEREMLIGRTRVGSNLDDMQGATFPLAEAPHVARALENLVPVAVTAPQNAAQAAIMQRHGFQSSLVVPLVTRGEPHGVIFLDYRAQTPVGTAEEHSFVQEMADALAIALERATLYERAQAQALRDPVTDLANHRAIHQALDAALSSPDVAGGQVAFVLLDVDNFKLFNDTYGHPVGDAVLQKLADHLRACSREHDIVGRYGGDEFALVLPRGDRSSAQRIATRLAHAVASTPYVAPDGSVIPLTVSVGVAVAPDDARTRQELVAVADAHMYASKRGDEGGPGLARSAADLLGQTTFGVLEGLVSAVDAKDRYTREHSLDVTRYALLLADALGLEASDRRTLAVAGPLHDAGKIAVPDRILRKPSNLTEDEYAAIKAHVTYGVAIVRGVLDDENVLTAIAEHHERYDGKGYPRGLYGSETSLLGRIMQIADAVSAMILDRPYRQGLSPDCVIAQLRRGAGSQFDPALVEPFIACAGLEALSSAAATAQLI